MAEEQTEIVPNSFADFIERFAALQSEAKSYGIPCLTALLDTDHINDCSDVSVIYHGGWMVALGMSQYASDYLLRHDREKIR